MSRGVRKLLFQSSTILSLVIHFLNPATIENTSNGAKRANATRISPLIKDTREFESDGSSAVEQRADDDKHGSFAIETKNCANGDGVQLHEYAKEKILLTVNSKVKNDREKKESSDNFNYAKTPDWSLSKADRNEDEEDEGIDDDDGDDNEVNDNGGYHSAREINSDEGADHPKRIGGAMEVNLRHYSKRAGRISRHGPKVWDQWGEWSGCSVTCGVGKLTRWRHCVGGFCSLGEKEAQLKTCTFAACKRPKIWDQWGKWSCCNVSCGPGKLSRWRHCIAGGCATGEKEAQIKSCKLKSC